MTFTINFNNGFVKDLDEAKQIAYDNMGYTQASINILDDQGNTVSTAFWFGVPPTDDDDVLAEFGTSGFYQQWTDY